MSRKIRWGILGCGNIADKFAADLKWIDDAELVAVASRSHLRANELATKEGVRFAFDSYEALVSCPEVDVIYIATPHGLHHEHVLLCLNHKKSVLCEKAFALNLWQATEMIETAKRNGVFIMEAFWTKFIPQFQKVLSLIDANALGELKLIQADFGFDAAPRFTQRIWDPVLGGGALLDVGIYPVFLAITLLGRPTEIVASMKPFPSGVDQQIAIILKFESGALANLSATFEATTPVEATIVGGQGYIKMTNRFYNATANVEMIKNGVHVDIGPIHREVGYGYQFEARHVGECLRQNLLESPIMRHEDTLLLMETLDRIRISCGIHYPPDDKK